MKKLRIAIIGQGRSGRGIHGEYFLSAANQKFEVVAIVDAIPERLEKGMKEFGCDGYSDYRELFTRKDIDLIVNASFSHLHYAIAKDCLSHGYNVLNEKPFAKTVYECMDLIKTAKENGVVITAFHQSLYGPTIIKLKEILASGKIGNVKQINLRYNGFGRRWDWQTLQSYCAGGVYNTAPHPIGIGLDLIDWDPAARVAYSHLDKALTSGDVEVKYIVDSELEPRPVTATPLTNPETGKPMYCSEKLPIHEEAHSTESDTFASGSHIFYEKLYDTLVNGAPLYITGEKAMKAIEIIEAVHAQNPMPLKY